MFLYNISYTIHSYFKVMSGFIWYNATKESMNDNNDYHGKPCALEHIITNEEWTTTLLTPLAKGVETVHGTTDEYSTYYYMDFPEDNVRVVMLNTTNGKYSESMSSTAMVSEEQIDWLINKALDTDKYVIVMSHIPFYWPEGKEGAGEASVKNGGLVLRAVENFISDGGKFVGYFHGHMHERTIHIDDNGRFHMGFMQGGNPGEAVMIDFEEKCVTSIILGNGETREVRF